MFIFTIVELMSQLVLIIKKIVCAEYGRKRIRERERVIYIRYTLQKHAEPFQARNVSR